jgi:antitoxin ParD1/3/4
LETLVRQKVQTGLYNNASEVVREALRLLDERDRTRRLREAIGVGLAQAERGETRPLTAELLAQIIQDAEEMARQGKQPNPDVCP